LEGNIYYLLEYILTLGSNKYFLLVLAEFSGYLSIIALKNKALEELKEGTMKLINEY
jgi:hypothetical protein